MKRNTNRRRGASPGNAGILPASGRRPVRVQPRCRFLFFSAVVLLASAAPAAAQTTVLSNATVIDATGAPPIEDAAVVIEGNRIAAIHTPSASAPDPGYDARVIDLGGAYVLPGLWNNHSHLGDLHPDSKGLLPDEPLLRAMIRAGRNAMDALKAGFTTLRITGERDFMDVAWKKAFDDGVFVGTADRCRRPAALDRRGHGLAGTDRQGTGGHPRGGRRQHRERRATHQVPRQPDAARAVDRRYRGGPSTRHPGHRSRRRRDDPDRGDGGRREHRARQRPLRRHDPDDGRGGDVPRPDHSVQPEHRLHRRAGTDDPGGGLHRCAGGRRRPGAGFPRRRAEPGAGGAGPRRDQQGVRRRRAADHRQRLESDLGDRHPGDRTARVPRHSRRWAPSRPRPATAPR